MSVKKFMNTSTLKAMIEDLIKDGHYTKAELKKLTQQIIEEV